MLRWWMLWCTSQNLVLDWSPQSPSRQECGLVTAHGGISFWELRTKGSCFNKSYTFSCRWGAGVQSAFSDWSVQGYQGLDNSSQFGTTLKVHPRSRAPHRTGEAPVEKFCMSELMIGDAITELSLMGARWHCLTIWNRMSAITVVNSGVGMVVRWAWTSESYGNDY